LKLPWRLLRMKLADLDQPTGLVEYASTFKSDTGAHEGGSERV